MTSPPFEGHPPSKAMSFVKMLDHCFFFFFLGQILPHFDHLKNMISTYTKIFHGKNGPNSPDFKKKVSTLPKNL
jgi:hypothetical protein